MLRFFLIFLRYVVLVSGLGLGGSRYDALATQMFIDTITGELGGLAVLMMQDSCVDSICLRCVGPETVLANCPSDRCRQFPVIRH